MKTKNGKLWNMASGLEVVGFTLFVIIIIPTGIRFFRAEIMDMQEEEHWQVQQEILIEELFDKINLLESERIAQ